MAVARQRSYVGARGRKSQSKFTLRCDFPAYPHRERGGATPAGGSRTAPGSRLQEPGPPNTANATRIAYDRCQGQMRSPDAQPVSAGRRGIAPAPAIVAHAPAPLAAFRAEYPPNQAGACEQTGLHRGIPPNCRFLTHQIDRLAEWIAKCRLQVRISPSSSRCTTGPR